MLLNTSCLVTYTFSSFRRPGQNRVGKRTAVLVDSFHNLGGLDIFKFFEPLFGNLILRCASTLGDPLHMRPAVTEIPGTLPGPSCS